MIELRRILHPFYRSGYTRSVLKALIPARYHERVRLWLRPIGGVQWCRVVMNREIEQFIQSLNCPDVDALEISGSGSNGRYGFRSYQIAQYPDYDIRMGPLAQEQFDLVIAEQVFEYVLRPDLVAAHVYQTLRPGGFFVISTPFLVKGPRGSLGSVSLDRTRDPTATGNEGLYRPKLGLLAKFGMPIRRHEPGPVMDFV